MVIRSSTGSEFHSLGPAMLKALSPQLFVLEQGTDLFLLVIEGGLK